MLAWGIGTTGQTRCIACGGIKTPTDSPTLVYKLGQVCVNSCGIVTKAPGRAVATEELAQR